jgi:hypothetical protein
VSNPVMVTMPLQLTPEMIKAVRAHPTTSVEYKDDEHARIGWLLCAWDVLVENRPHTAPLPIASSAMRGCSVCGIGSDGKVMGYVCSRGDCPSKITCAVQP